MMLVLLFVCSFNRSVVRSFVLSTLIHRTPSGRKGLKRSQLLTVPSRLDKDRFETVLEDHTELSTMTVQ